MGLAAGAVFATCASVVVVALAFALYALVEPFWGRAGAAAVVAGAAALLMFLIAAVLMAGSAPPKPRKGAAPGPEAALDRVVDFLKERPYVAIAAAVAA
ncbi:MAG TPA: hypothetical protein VG939_17040, partial [Caulobacteraceae bacterium]|nr:hypothetical protein [Caulobacteraceae bacterium]